MEILEDLKSKFKEGQCFKSTESGYHWSELNKLVQQSKLNKTATKIKGAYRYYFGELSNINQSIIVHNERQSHGFQFEDYCANKYNLIKNTTINYTSKWDYYTCKNNIPVSIKTHQKGTGIELSDYFRQSHIIDDFIMIIGFWEGQKSNIVEEYCLYIDGIDWHSHFNLKLETKLLDLLDNITNDKSDDALWKKTCNELKDEFKKTTDCLIVPRFKRDHKKQKRIQCAINNISFYQYFLDKFQINSMEVING